MIAILEALSFLIEKPPISCVIFTDSLSCNQCLKSDSVKSAIHLEVKYKLYQLWCLGVPVFISWIPSHVGILGNERVDSLARQAIFHQVVDLPILQDTADLYKTLKENIIKEWQLNWDLSKKGRFYYTIQHKVSEKVQYSNQCRKKQTILTRLRFGKCLTADTLYLLKRKENDLCDVCNVKEDVNHFLQECQQFTDLQVGMNDAMLGAGVIPCTKTLLGIEKWHDMVYQYVMDTKRDM